MLSVAGEFVAIGRVVVEHQQWIAGLRRQRPKEHMHFRPHRLVDPWHACIHSCVRHYEY